MKRLLNKIKKSMSNPEEEETIENEYLELNTEASFDKNSKSN